MGRKNHIGKKRSGGLSHVDAEGRARMVDVGGKPDTAREATAEATVIMAAATYDLAAAGRAEKGDVFAAARLAGIQAAKRTPDLIPLCHPLLLTSVSVEFSAKSAGAGKTALVIRATARCEGRTGVEMEAMTAVAVGALTVYDMCKAADRWMTIRDIRLMEKSGGKSGNVRRPGRKK